MCKVLLAFRVTGNSYLVDYQPLCYMWVRISDNDRTMRDKTALAMSDQSSVPEGNMCQLLNLSPDRHLKAEDVSHEC